MAVSATMGLANPAKGETSISNNAKDIVNNANSLVVQTELAVNLDNPATLAALPQGVTELETGDRNLASFSSQTNLHDSDHFQDIVATDISLQNTAREGRFSTGEAMPTTLEFSQGFSQELAPQISQPPLEIRANIALAPPVPEIAEQSLTGMSNLPSPTNSSLPPAALLLALGERGRVVDRPLPQNLPQNSPSANLDSPNHQTLLAQTPATPTPNPVTPRTPPQLPQ
ncbi:MAG: hypothetical protein HC916_13615 [Coleofasciculaceae cyanobacterium SM2_1_6]|nr:hypothetical protein [Coleofasciculaceae cyanobacterium SM2_1_6]